LCLNPFHAPSDRSPDATKKGHLIEYALRRANEGGSIMSEMAKLQGPLPEAVGTAGYTMAVGLYTVMVSKGLMTKAEARRDFKRWSERAKRLEGAANKDARTDPERSCQVL
jgi:hypothetical protein